MTIDYADPTQVEAAVHAQLEDLDPLDAVAVLDDVRAALVESYTRKILGDHFAAPADDPYGPIRGLLTELLASGLTITDQSNVR